MHPLSDKDLDRLSREAADQYDVEQNTSGWEKLQHQLNKHLPEIGKKERRRFLLLLWFFALLSGGGLVWILTADNESKVLIAKDQSLKTTLPVDKNKELSGSTKTANETAKSGSQKAERPEVQNSADNNKELQSIKPGSTIIENAESNSSDVEKKISNQNLTATKISRQKSARQADRRNNDLTRRSTNTIDRKKNTMIDKGVASSGPSTENATGKRANDSPVSKIDKKPEENISSTSPVASAPPIQDEKKISSIPDDQTITKEDDKAIPETASVIQQKSVPKVKSSFNKGMEIGLVAAPDMSNVKFSHTDNLGFNVGLQLGYRFSKRWSVNTGLFYTKKNYTARGMDFTPPKGTWLDNVLLNEVEGNCFMFDIPLNIRYDLTTGRRGRYFVSTGLSTYLMNTEHYDYYYLYANGSAGNRYRSYPSNERYWFSILNVSAGFEKTVNKRFSIQAEPYFKVPLGGIGYGNIQLNSYGMYFSLKYKPSFGPRKK